MNLSRQSYLKKGSYTVEAAFIMIIVLFTQIALIYMGFYVYNRGILQGIANKLATDVAYGHHQQIDLQSGKLVPSKMNEPFIYWRFGGRKLRDRNEIIAYGNELLNKNYFGMEEVTLAIDLENHFMHPQIAVKLTGKMDIPFQEVLALLNNGNPLLIEVHSYSNIEEPAEFVRTVSLFNKSIREIKHFEPMVQKYDALIDKITKLLVGGKEGK